MNLSGRKVKFIKLHSPIFFNGQQSSATFSSPAKPQEGFRDVVMTLCDQGVLIETTGKDPKNKVVYSVLVTTYECAELYPAEAPIELKPVKK